VSEGGSRNDLAQVGPMRTFFLLAVNFCCLKIKGSSDYLHNEKRSRKTFKWGIKNKVLDPYDVTKCSAFRDIKLKLC
jgi:hypothetical protein